ncbi:VanZ family protein [Methylobacter luteus]|uniref:VanZ family protein n=1 Tax=Methylobacter luteus TaxID=415 RepID=UPI0004889562|nr:VanZ family protein [Methylobacter luteus]
MNKILDFTFLLAYCLLIYWLSDQPSLPAPQWFVHQDKLHHAGVYFVMALLAWRTFRHWIDHPIILPILAVAFCSLYGVYDEWHQSFVQGRTSDVADWIADTTGAAMAIFLFYKLRIRSQVRIKL